MAAPTPHQAPNQNQIPQHPDLPKQVPNWASTFTLENQHPELNSSINKKNKTKVKLKRALDINMNTSCALRCASSVAMLAGSSAP
jgi:hypothetical protein